MPDKKEGTTVGTTETISKPETTLKSPVGTGPVRTEWDEVIGGFANAVGKDLEDINKAVAEFVGEPSDAVLPLLMNPETVTDGELATAMTAIGIPVAIFRHNKHMLRKEEPVEVETPAEQRSATNPYSFNMLPSVGKEDDISLLDSLKVGGALKLKIGNVVSAVRVALASRVGYFDLPEALLKEMDVRAEKSGEPHGEIYFKLRKMIKRRRHADILESFDEIKGNYFTVKEKQGLIKKIDSTLWKSLYSFQKKLEAWVTQWQTGAAGPAAMSNLIAALSGGPGGAMPMMQSPPTTIIRSAAKEVINNINSIFAGSGVLLSISLFGDAIQVKKFLDTPSLPALINAANKDEMLKTLGVNLPVSYTDLETYLSRYVMSIDEVNKKVPGNEENMFMMALFQVGHAIPWDDLLNDMEKRIVEDDSTGRSGRRNAGARHEKY